MAYMSKKLEPHHRKYSVIEKLPLAVITSMDEFEMFLHGHVVVYSDHNPLKFVETMKCKNARKSRWKMMLQDRDIGI